MKFRIHRTSNDSKPIAGAHTVEIERPHWKYHQTMYVIEVDTIEELMDIVNREESPIIVFPADEFHNNLPSLEIHDDYRE